MKTTGVYVVGPQNTFAIHQREVNEITTRGDHPRATHVAQRRSEWEADVVCDLSGRLSSC